MFHVDKCARIKVDVTKFYFKKAIKNADTTKLSCVAIFELDHNLQHSGLLASGIFQIYWLKFNLTMNFRLILKD